MSDLAKVEASWPLSGLSQENIAMIKQIDADVQAKKHSDDLEMRRLRYRARRAKDKKGKKKK